MKVVISKAIQMSHLESKPEEPKTEIGIHGAESKKKN